MPSLSPVQIRKFTTLFQQQARHDKQFLTMQDYTLLATAISTAFDWPNRDPHQSHFRLAALKSHLQSFFLRLQTQSDSNKDGKITLEEYLAYMYRQVQECKNMGVSAPWVKESTRQLLLLIDQHASDSLTCDEYRKMLTALESDADPQAAFDRLDLDQDGELNRAELDRLALEFMLSNDPDAPGNLLYCGKW